MEEKGMAPMFRGFIIMLLGIILLLHTLGIVQQIFSVFLVLISIYLIFYGFVRSGLYSFIKNIFTKKQQKE